MSIIVPNTMVESWKRRLAYAGITALLIVALLVTTTLVWRAFFSDPPIRITNLEPPSMGVLCPGQHLPIRVQVSISDAIVMHYYVSVMDYKGEQNMIGTQRVFTDMLHPRVAVFSTTFSWTVPDLPPGRYRRVLAARNVVGHQKTVFVEQFFEIGDACLAPPLPR